MIPRELCRPEKRLKPYVHAQSFLRVYIKMSDEEFNDYNVQLSDDEHTWLSYEGIQLCIILLIKRNGYNTLEI